MIREEARMAEKVQSEGFVKSRVDVVKVSLICSLDDVRVRER
jgi:hypothetical protein